jgi:hypothetical protein
MSGYRSFAKTKARRPASFSVVALSICGESHSRSRSGSGGQCPGELESLRAAAGERQCDVALNLWVPDSPPARDAEAVQKVRYGSRIPSNHCQRICRRRLGLPAFPWNTLATASAAFQFHRPRTVSICFAGNRLNAEATARATGSWRASRSQRAKPGGSCGQSVQMRRLSSCKLCSYIPAERAAGKRPQSSSTC